ncbi:MAG: DUF4339 domain-containing protein [Chlamydiales bacterium]|nr:DUF4339 domain-containing protein [Chlamydiales bacterium]
MENDTALKLNEALGQGQLLFMVIMAIFFAFLGYKLAQKTNRDPIIWGIISGIFPLLGIAGLCLLFIFADNTKSKRRGRRSSKHTTYDNSGRLSSPERADQEALGLQEQVHEIKDQDSYDKDSDDLAMLWYYVDKEKREKKGSYILEEMKHLFNEEIISTDTFVWSKGMKEWKQIKDLPDLAEKLVAK